MAYQIEDKTSERNGIPVGYLRLLLDGKRVCDFFPFADKTDPVFIRLQALLIAQRMNAPIEGE
jgi:hypothetical protein